MIVPDVNLLVYSYDRSSPFHAAARIWWEEALSGRGMVGIPWVALLGFVRIVTHPTLNENPMTVLQAQSIIESWLERPSVELLCPGRATFVRFFELLEPVGIGGNLCTDALIAAHALECTGVVHSTDSDFSRFPGLRWLNPLAVAR